MSPLIGLFCTANVISFTSVENLRATLTSRTKIYIITSDAKKSFYAVYFKDFSHFEDSSKIHQYCNTSPQKLHQ